MSGAVTADGYTTRAVIHKYTREFGQHAGHRLVCVVVCVQLRECKGIRKIPGFACTHTRSATEVWMFIIEKHR